MTETREVKLHPKQYDAFCFSTQYCAVIAGVQGGKTFIGAYWTAFEIESMPKDGIGLICAPTYKILQQSTLPKFFKEFPYYRQFYKEQKGVIELPDGKIIYIRSMDDPYGVEGMTLNFCWGDEAGRFKLMAWIVLRSRTAIKKGKIFFTTTPYNLGWLYKDFYIPCKEGMDKDLSVYTWASIENPYFPKDFFEKEKVRLSKTEFARRYLGEFTRMEGLVYEIHNWQIIEPKEIRAEITFGGIDWGFNNPAALIVIKYADGVYHIVDEWYQTNKTTPEIIEAAKQLQNKWGVNRWYADSANPEKIEEANYHTGLYVIGYEKKKDAITSGISTIQQLFRENRILVFKNCVNFLDEAESYHYPEILNDKNPKEEPEPFDNHLMDAMRYAIHGFQPATRIAVKPVSQIEHLLMKPMNKNRNNNTENYE
jgi:phage terminase large subunit